MMPVDKNSIVFKMTGFVIGLIIIQSILLMGTLVLGGVLEQARENAFQSFHDKVYNRKDYIQREMKNRWTNMSPYVQQIVKNLDEGATAEAFFQLSSSELIDMLRTTQTTGAFIILEEAGRHPALYIRDYDPLLNDYSNKDLYMVLGSAKLAKGLKIPLDQIWSQELQLDAGNENFFKKPFENAKLTSNAGLLGYWSPPFILHEEDGEIMTYTMPLMDQAGSLRGIIGIEVSLNYFKQFMPATDLQLKDSMGYMIGYSGADENEIRPSIMVGALQNRMIRGDEVLALTTENENLNIYTIENQNASEKLYACIEQMGLYSYNTPFEGERWYLIGMMTEGSLLSYVRKIQQILSFSVLISLLLGIGGGYLVSFRFTKPITTLVRQLKARDKGTRMQFDQVGLTEIDALTNAIMLANEALLESTVKMSKIIDLADFPIAAFEMRNDTNHVFITDQLNALLGLTPDYTRELICDKKRFSDHIRKMLTRPEKGEDAVYRVENGHVRYLKIKMVKSENSLMGVIVDMTNEMLDKQKIKAERDYDPLTMIYNRKAVQHHIEQVLGAGEELGTAALVMFDLDNLKKVNDTYGHEGGDLYIQSAVGRLEGIGGEKRLLGRRSGDEFVLFLYGYADRDALRRELEEFYADLKQRPMTLPDGTLQEITISGGLYWLGSADTAYDHMLKMADECLYEAKNRSKGCFMECEA